MADEVELLYDDDFGASMDYEQQQKQSLQVKQRDSVSSLATSTLQPVMKKSAVAQQQQQQSVPGTGGGVLPANPPRSPDGAPPTSALYISDLTFVPPRHQIRWTSDEDLERASGEFARYIKAIVFQEFKVNGKSKGIAYVEFENPTAAAVVKDLLSKIELSGKKPYVSFVHASQIGQPFRQSPLDSLERPGARNTFQQQQQQQSASSSYQSHHQQPSNDRSYSRTGGDRDRDRDRESYRDRDYRGDKDHRDYRKGGGGSGSGRYRR